MNLFALTQEPARRILRIPLAQNIQTEVEALFRHQEQDFTASVEEEHAFDGKYKPDEGECLVITDFDDIDNIHEAIAHPLGIPEISPDPAEFATVKALFSGYRSDTGERIALIQSFDRRKIISSAGISIFHSANVYKKVDGVGLTLDNRLAAMLVGSSLKFFSFHLLRQVFDLSAYYVEATTTDLQAFAQINTVHFANAQAFVDTADSWIRRKVTLISQSQILDNVDPATIQRVARTFGIDVQTVNVGGQDAIAMPAGKADLKKILRFLDEDYYQSALQSRNFVTNSKRPA
jgi:hypothetical protein